MQAKHRLLTAIVAGALGFVTTPALAQRSISLQTAGANGGAAIPILDYSQGFSRPDALGARTQCGNASFQKLLDNSSTFFLAHATSGQEIPRVTISFQDVVPVKGLVTNYVLTLTNVAVESISQSGSAGGDVALIESISLQADAFVFTFTPVDAAGNLGSPVRVGWNCVTNTPIN
jgi:type VI protein secretion system component Hcp